MAPTWGEKIEALTGFPATGSSNLIGDETGQELATEWLTDGATEVINILPPQLYERTAVISAAFAPNTGSGISDGETIRVLRSVGSSYSSSQKDIYECRKISYLDAGKASDPNSIFYATETDPVYYILQQTTGNTAKIFVLPESTDSVAKVIKLNYLAITSTDTAATANYFPKEAEDIVLLFACVRAAEYLVAHEQDMEIHGTILQSMKQDYLASTQSFLSKYGITLPQFGGGQQQGGAPPGRR